MSEPAPPDDLTPLGEPLVQVPLSVFGAFEISACVLLAIAAIVVTPLVWAEVLPFTQHMPLKLLWTLLIAPGSLLLSAVMLRNAQVQRKRRVLTGPGGFALVSPTEQLAFPWERIKTVWGGEFGKVVERDDGVKFHFEEFKFLRIRQAVPIDRCWVPMKIREAEGQLDQGEPVPFGPFDIIPKGVRHRGKLLRWAEIDRATRVHIFGDNPFMGVGLLRKGSKRPGCLEPYRDVPNHLVFLELVGMMVKEHREREAETLSDE